MADVYVDYTVGASGAGTTWATAYKTLQEGITNALAGGRVFVRTDASATTKDTATGGNRTLTTPGTEVHPVRVYGCKSTTSAEPPTASDFTVRGTDNLPVFEVTGAGNDIVFDAGWTLFYGLAFDAADRFNTSANSESCALFHRCEVTVPSLIFSQAEAGLLSFTDCDLISSTGTYCIARSSGRIEFKGGLWSGTSPTYIVDGSTRAGRISFDGVDLTNCTGDVVDGDGDINGETIFRYCRMASNLGDVSTGALTGARAKIEFIGCTDDSGLGTYDAILEHNIYMVFGDCVTERTAVRTGGANDGVEGIFSYAITPNTNSTDEPYWGMPTPWMTTWVKGDGAAKTIEVCIANDGASDYNEGDVYGEVFVPNAAGTNLWEHFYDNNYTEIEIGSPTALTDDTTSVWGTGASNPQRVVFDDAGIAPDYQGPVMVRLFFCKRFSSSPETLYVDPKPIIT